MGVDTKVEAKDIDFLIYDKVLGPRPVQCQSLIQPILNRLSDKGLSLWRLSAISSTTIRPIRLCWAGRVRWFFCASTRRRGWRIKSASRRMSPYSPGTTATGSTRTGRNIRTRLPVAASSVPAATPAECGERFRGIGDFDYALDRFLGRMDTYTPRAFVERELDFGRSAGAIATWTRIKRPVSEMKSLLIITAVAKPHPSPDEVTPRMDYHALAKSLRESGTADIVDYAAVDKERNLLVRIARRLAGRDAGLAVMAFFRQRGKYDSIFSNGENVAIPLALLFKLVRRRPGHITICHRMSAAKKRPFFTLLKAHRQIDPDYLQRHEVQLEFARTSGGSAFPRTGWPA